MSASAFDWRRTARSEDWCKMRIFTHRWHSCLGHHGRDRGHRLFLEASDWSIGLSANVSPDIHNFTESEECLWGRWFESETPSSIATTSKEVSGLFEPYCTPYSSR